jgi:calcium/calmodulin-dependent protein kinase I
MTIDECLAHPWLAEFPPTPAVDLLPRVRKGFNAKRMFKKAVDAVKVVHKLTHASRSKLNGSGNNLNVPGPSNASSRSNSANSFEDGVIPSRKSDVGDQVEGKFP